MRAYIRTSRRTGISMPFWLALIVGAYWLAAMAVVFMLTVILAAAIGAFRLGQLGRRAWRERSSTGPGDT